MLASKLLASLGVAAVEEARDGLDAALRAALREEAPHDLVILDLQMPRLTGLEAASEIQLLALRHGRPAPVLVAWTACAGEQTRQKCEAAGFARFVGKPCRKVDFGALLASLPDPASHPAATP
eukprot:tig00001224_g7631.t1